MIGATPLLLSTLFIGYLYYLLSVTRTETIRSWRAQQSASAIAWSGSLLFDAVSMVTRYGLTGNSSYAQQLKKIEKQAANQMQLARDANAGNGKKLDKLKELSEVQQEAFSILDMAVSDFEKGHGEFLHVASVRTHFEVTLSHFAKVHGELMALEEARGVPTEVDLQWINNLQYVLIAGLAGNVVLTLLIVSYFNRSIVSRLQRITDNTVLLAEQKTLHDPQFGTDEIAQLDTFFHEMAQRLEESNRKQRAIVEKAVDVICTIDGQGKITTVNPAACEVWGYEVEELQGQPVDMLIAAGEEKLSEVFDDVRNKSAVFRLERRLRRKDLTSVDTLWSVHWSAPEQQLFCVCHDISDRKLAENVLRESEQRTRTMLETMPVGLFVLSRQGEIELLNDAAEKMFGYKKSELLCKPIQLLLPSIDLNLVPGKTEELSGTTKEGAVLPVEAGLSDLTINGEQRRLVIVMDITERFHIEELRQQFVAMITHDLRTPLASMRITLHLMSSGAYGALTDRGVSALKRSDNEINRLISLINDLLDFEKLRAGEMSLEPSLISVADVIADSCDVVRDLASNKNISLVIDADGAESVIADRGRIIQVLVNLMSNAIKFSPSDSTIKVNASSTDECVEFSVKDQGRGIAPDAIQRLFEKYTQVRASDQKTGTGLGLAICKAIVQQHGGAIHVSSEEGIGSVFSFRIPRLKTFELV